MATEYYQIPSSQGMLSLDASTSSFSSSTSSLSSSLQLPANAFTPLSNNTTMSSNDPWLGTAMKNMSLDDWNPATKRSTGVPSLFEPDDIEARSWENVVPLQTPEVLKASFELKNSYEIKNPQKVPTRQFISTSSKIDAWTVVDPSVTVSTKMSKPKQFNNLNMSLTMSQQQMANAQMSSSQGLQNSQGLMDSEDGSDRYKTELCKSFTETGVCRYGVKCQFAHGKEELRSVLRHPKYKTEICKTFHNTGTCPYGIRCRFIHTRTKDENSVFSSSTSALPDPEQIIEELDDNVEIVNKMAPPPGIPVPQWSKSWFSSSTGSMTKKQVTRKAF
eukprot:TRINITY_DN246_c8_g1_i1.p1 TRINITY_DN246_c8_g1~~TRINITY_DN246_c8_g1_i1.p1  ORF type:complete len:332 (+),score=118.57 TRINITY_DN246_c8_g1_i1:83-1078(+)